MWFIASVDPIAFLLTGQLHHLWSRGDPRLLLKNLQNKYLMRKDELLGSGKIGKRREEPESLKISHFSGHHQSAAHRSLLQKSTIKLPIPLKSGLLAHLFPITQTSGLYPWFSEKPLQLISVKKRQTWGQFPSLIRLWNSNCNWWG